MSLFSRKSKAEPPAQPKFEDRLDVNNNHYPILGNRGHDDVASVIHDFDEGTRTIYELGFVCGQDFETKKGKKKLEQGRVNFKATDAKNIYLVAGCSWLGGYKQGFLIADDGIYFTDNDDVSDFYSWDRFDRATITHSYEDLSIDNHKFITQEAQMLSFLLESLQDK